MITDNEFDREHELFSLCIERPREEWAEALQSHCDDSAMRERVLRLLEHHRDTPTHDSGFLRLDGSDPDRIGPYRILQRLGEGGMGIVYAAEQREPMRRRVAIKVLRSGYSSREVLARFDVERQALALMNHANIARILDAGTTADHRPFIVMEFVPGEPITRYCEQRDLSLNARLTLLRTVCEAVQHAHQKGVIHRDLKPSNILVMEEDGEPIPKIIDFGIAKAVSQPLTDHTLETKVGSLLGTPDYMSPEQAELSPLDVDTRSDVYALGAVMYRLLTGVPPLQLSGSTKSYTDIQRAILDETPPPPSQKVDGTLRRQLRGDLDWIVLKALEKRRADRYASAADLAADIRRHLDNETVSAGPPSRLRKIDKFVRRYWLATASVLAIIVTLSVSQMLLIQKNRELEIERDRASVEAATSENVTTFLLDIFKASNPTNADGGKVMARDLLDRGREKIAQDASLPDDVRLRLTLSLAKAYASLWLIIDTVELYEQSLALYLSSGTDDPAVKFEILYGLGHWLAVTERPQEARNKLDAALAIAALNPSVPPQRVTSIRGMLSRLEMELGHFEQAQAQAEALFTEMRDRFGIENAATLQAGAMLASVYNITADFDAAERLLQELVPAAHHATGEDSQYSYAMRYAQGALYYALGRREDAERELGLVYRHYLEKFGPDAITTQTIANEYALTLADSAAALQMLEHNVARQREQYGNDAPLLVDTLQNLAVIHLRIAGHETQAEHYLAEARALSEKISGREHLATRSVYFELARLHARTGREESALAFLRDVGDIPVYQYEASRDPDFATLRNNLEFVTFLGRFRDGEPDLP
ncbi:MAG TPA: serine/threonine-protein kinase [Gammaproteobacteria bacterium]